MKKGAAVLGIMLFVFFMGVGLLWVSANDTSPPSEVLIKNTGYKRIKKGPVKFSHEKHVKEYKVACNECHHIYKDGKNVWKPGQSVEKCAECHNPIKKKGQKPMSLMLAYHKNCMGCHKKLAKEGKISQQQYKKLRKCNTCHAKKSKKSL